MTMSPEDITGKTFQTKFMGVNPDEVKSHLEQLAGEFTALKERVGKLKQTITDQQKELILAADDKKAFEDVANVFKDNIEKLKSELRVKEQNGMELLKELESLSGQVEKLSQERDGLKSELNGKNTQISELESKYRMSRAAVDELRKKQVLLEAESTAMKDEAEDRNQQLSRAREEFDDLAEQARQDSSKLLESAREEVERMRREASLELVQIKDDIEVLSSRRKQIHGDLRNLLNTHLRKLDDLPSGNPEQGHHGYDDLFQTIDFTELAEFEEGPSFDEGESIDAADPGEGVGDSEDQLKNKLEDGGIAYLSGE